MLVSGNEALCGQIRFAKAIPLTSSSGTEIGKRLRYKEPGLFLYSLMFLFVVFVSIVVWIRNDYWIIRAFAVFMGAVGVVFSVRYARNIFRH